MANDDAALVQLARSGDHDAFAQLYDKYARLVRAICYDATHDLEQAQDLGQEAFIRAYQKLNTLKKPEQFAPWLISMSKNVCREYRRSMARNRLQLVNFESDDVAAKGPEPENELIIELERAIGQLPEKQQLALRAYYLQDQDIEQCLTIMQMSRSSFYRLLEKAKKAIEAKLSDIEEEL